MIDHVPLYLLLCIAFILLMILADKMRIAYPVMLVIAGLVISFIPGVPLLQVDPNVIFVVFLPPLLYEAAWSVSWKELWRWRRIIGSFAFLVVFFIAFSVALLANHILPGFTLALGFLLGAIVSPPDAVSAGAILKFTRVPKRLSSILQGESLLNDAAALIIFRFALIAVGSGQFIWYRAALSFSWMLAGGIGIGCVIGWLFMFLHKKLPTTANMDLLLTFITPYTMYLAAEELHSSGTLAVVAGGLLLSNNRYVFLDARSRLKTSDVWESVIFVLNGIVFLLIGLALPSITEGLRKEGIGLNAAIGYGLLITAILIVARMIAVYSAVWVTIIARNFITVAETHPGYRMPTVIGWAGMRGVVSLAAALSIPLQWSNGHVIPNRNLILFITYIVILVSLLLQGLTLPYLIKLLKLPAYKDYLSEEESHQLIKEAFVQQGLPILQHNQDSRWSDDGIFYPPENTCNKAPFYEILQKQRQWLVKRNQTDRHLDEDIVRKYLRMLDAEEERLG